MRLASLLESQQSKKLAGIIVRRRKPLGILLYVVGLVYLLQLPRDELNHRSFIDENALMTGLVRREFNDANSISHYAEQLEPVYDDRCPHFRDYLPLYREELMNLLHDQLARIGLEVYRQNYSATRPAVLGQQSVDVRGCNVYGILRAGRSSSAESLVLSVPYLTPGESNNLHGLAVMLSLAKYFKSRNYWAKDIIFLVTTGEEVGTRAWIDSYMGGSTIGITAAPLPGRSGAIQAVLNLELSSPNIQYTGLLIEGVNGILPNLDLVHVVTHLSEMEGIPSALHVGWEAVRSHGRRSTSTSPFYSEKLRTLAALIAHQAPGLPLANHALFLRHRIDSVTLRGIGSGLNSKPIFSLARALEGSFRSLNNLLERLHHSEFFYYAPSRGRFISIGQFIPPLALLLAPLVLEALSHWLLARGYHTSSEDGTNESPQTPFPFHSVLNLILPSSLSGVLLLCLPRLAAMVQAPLGSSVLIATLAWGSLFSIFTTLFSSSTVPVRSWHMAKFCSLILQLLLLLAMAVMNYGLSVCLLLFLPLPAILSQSSGINGRLHHRLGQLLLLLFSPPLSILYLCCLYHAVFISRDPTDVSAVLEGGVGIVGQGLVMAYNSWYFVGSWLFPLGCVAVWPVWLMGWRLACQNVCSSEQSDSSHLHSD